MEGCTGCCLNSSHLNFWIRWRVPFVSVAMKMLASNVFQSAANFALMRSVDTRPERCHRSAASDMFFCLFSLVAGEKLLSKGIRSKREVRRVLTTQTDQIEMTEITSRSYNAVQPSPTDS